MASLAITLPAIALAPLGARLTSRLHCAALKRLLGYFLLAAAPLIPFKSWLFSTRQPENKQPNKSEAEVPEGDSLDISAASLQGSLAQGNVAVVPAGAPGLGTTTEGRPQAAPGQAAHSLTRWVQQLWQQAPDGPVMAGLAAAGGAAGFTSGLLGIGGGTVGKRCWQPVLLESLILSAGQAAAGHSCHIGISQSTRLTCIVS